MTNRERQTQGYNRRNVIQGIVGGLGVLGLSSVTAGSDSTVDIEAIKHGQETVKVEFVSEDWWTHILTAREAKAELRSQYVNDQRISGIDFGINHDNVISSRKGRVLRVRVEPESFQDVEVPSDVNGIPVEKYEEPETRLECSESVDDTEHSFVPGGSQMHLEGINPDEEFFSNACRVYFEGDNEPKMLTSAHQFVPDWSCGGKDPADRVEHRFNDVGLPFRSNSDYNLDYAIVHLSSASEIAGLSGDVKHSNNTRRELMGHVTENGYETYVEETVHKYGARTSHTSGELKPLRDDGRCSNESDAWFHNETCSLTGDSGRPHYLLWEDPVTNVEYAALIGVHGGSVGSSAESRGCTAFTIFEAEGEDISFGQPP